MKVATRLLGFCLLLAVAFGVAVAVGGATDVKPKHGGHSGDAMSDMPGMSADAHGGDAHGGDAMSDMPGMSTAGGELPPGLAVAQGDVRLVPERTTFQAGRAAPFRFQIVDKQGRAVRDFDVEHTKRMHLIAVRRDYAGYQHVHPVMADDGTWSVPLRFDDAGVYRVFADFQLPGVGKTVLATDVFVPGDFQPQAVPAPVERTSVDGYDVTIRGAPRAGSEGTLTFAVSREGKPVAVQPYLGADGHLVALRDGDLAYLHVHPQETPGSGGPIVFMTEYPSVGTYRLFLQFKHENRIHTAAFTQEVK